MRSGTLDLIVVDYVELMRGGASNRQSRRGRVGFLARLKQLARELDWPVIAVSQLDGASSSAPEVVTTRMDSRLRYLPIAAIVLVDARLSTGP